MTDALSEAIRAWLTAELQTAVVAALNPTPPTPATPTPDLNSKLDAIIMTLDDIKTALATEETAEKQAIAIMAQQAATISSLSAQLATAIASGNPAAMQSIVTQMQADAAAMQAAVTAAGGTPAPAPTTPVPVAPGAPVIT
jgi:hypothetical protein